MICLTEFQPKLIQDEIHVLFGHTVLVIIKSTKFAVAVRLRCGSVAVAVNGLFVFISSFFQMFKNVVHSLEPGETLSNSAAHQAPKCATFLNIAKYFNNALQKTSYDVGMYFGGNFSDILNKTCYCVFSHSIASVNQG